MDDVPALFGDNLGATYFCANPIFHFRIKHIDIEYHFVRLMIQSKVLRVLHISSGDQLADLFIKALLRGPFEKKLLQDWCFQTTHYLKGGVIRNYLLVKIQSSYDCYSFS